MSDRLQVCDACGGDGGGDYCSGHYGGEPVYQHVTCGECGGTGQVDAFAQRETAAPSFSCDLDEEIPF